MDSKTPKPSRRQFSHSRLASLEDCPRKYKYRYVDKIPQAFNTIEAFMGTCVHEALGWAYLKREEGVEVTEDQLVERFLKEWEEKLVGSIKVIKRGRDAESYRRDAEKMIREHHAGPFAEDELETLAIEPRVSTKVLGHTFMGFIDRLARNRETGQLTIVDWKTGRMPESVEAAGEQLRGYGLAVLEKEGGWDVELEYVYVKFGKSLKQTLGRSELPAVADKIAARMTACFEAEDAGDFPARPSGLCAWCGYREICDVSGYTANSGATPSESETDPSACPRCGEALKMRQGRNGPFFGCTGFPRCKFSRDPLPGEAG